MHTLTERERVLLLLLHMDVHNPTDKARWEPEDCSMCVNVMNNLPRP